MHFYDLNKQPAQCPKCKHTFDPNAVVRARRKAVRREAPESKAAMPTTILAQKKLTPRKKEPKETDGGGEGGIGDIAEMEDVDDIAALQELSELEEMEEPVVSGDDADEEALIEDIENSGEKTLVGNVEEEEAKALGKEIEEEEQESTASKKSKQKKKPK